MENFSYALWDMVFNSECDPCLIVYMMAPISETTAEIGLWNLESYSIEYCHPSDISPIPLEISHRYIQIGGDARWQTIREIKYIHQAQQLSRSLWGEEIKLNYDNYTAHRQLIAEHLVETIESRNQN